MVEIDESGEDSGARDESEAGDRGRAETVSESIGTETTEVQTDSGSESSEDTEET